MKFTHEQMQALQPLEPYFETAVRASWSRAVPRILMETCHRIWEQAIGRHYPFILNCAQCQLNLLRDAGTVYLAQKAEEAERKVELADEPAKPVRKKKVTTKR